jgi:hypothetical protein
MREHGRNRIDALLNRHEAPDGNPVIHGPRREPERKQLRPRHAVVLPPGELHKLNVQHTT